MNTMTTKRVAQAKVVQPMEKVDFSCIMVVYKAKNGSWRGFAHPYNVTIEADTKSKASKALKEMVQTYEDGLKKYRYPTHLARKHLFDDEDNKRFEEISIGSISKQGKIIGTDFYAEAKKLSA